MNEADVVSPEPTVAQDTLPNEYHMECVNEVEALLIAIVINEPIVLPDIVPNDEALAIVSRTYVPLAVPEPIVCCPDPDLPSVHVALTEIDLVPLVSWVIACN